MLADDIPCNARNSFPGKVFNGRDHAVELYGENVEVDYRGDEVSVESFLRLLTGRTLPGTPPSKVLASDEHSNIIIYMNGHGGDRFLKFQDLEEVSSHDLGGALAEMDLKRRYHRVLFVVDTCQASTLFEEVNSPNIVCMGSSLRGENSYAKGSDPSIGVSLMDRFTAAMLDFFENASSPESSKPGNRTPAGEGRGGGERVREGRIEGMREGRTGSMGDEVTMDAMIHSLKSKNLLSHPHIEMKGWTGPPLDQVPATDFFGSVLRAELTWEPYDLVGEEEESETASLGQR
ncbi:unnamed protein product [Discosporangium mesarthrocarpum]